MAGMLTCRTQSSGTFLKMETQLNKVRREAQEYEQKIKELEEEVNALEVQCDALEHKPSTLGVCVHSLFANLY